MWASVMAAHGRPGNRLRMQPWALSLPDKELCSGSLDTGLFTRQIPFLAWEQALRLLCFRVRCQDMAYGLGGTLCTL